ncbi:FecCD family ABC transporter permease [Crenobacter cavernae]|uniref:Iron ABC transporter permease n=1 Tax=Crenobacter cavernae TaxID=2290923 RepID=A0A345Y820_9NEIS|nr:iron ABC transporter permease [Crenobacter cavernae]AXK40072.1 iron ABC transporter permease [Crenobacter cavernae]
MKPRAVIGCYGLATVLLVGLAAGLSGEGWGWPRLADPLLTGIRLPRIAASLMVGASLAAAGAALQAVFRNPLADPGLIGTSAGAVLAAVAVLALGLAGIALPFAAFVGALVGTLLVLALYRLVGGGLVALLIIGVIVGAFFGAITNLLLLLSDDLTLRGAMSWLAGNLSDAGFASLGQAGLVMLTGFVLLIALGRDLDCLMLGEETAASLGVRVERTRVLAAVGAALTAGAAVSLSGLIGFVGMMVPNAVALTFGGCRRGLIWRSAWAGALFLLVVDTVARRIAYPVDLPAGTLAAFAGAPFFIWLLFRQQGGRNA